MKNCAVGVLIVAILFFTASACFAGNKSCNRADACSSWTPAVVGGPVAKGKNLLSVRYMADANIELTYKNQVILIDAYYDKGPDFLKFIDMDQVKRADAIFVGHAHGDHMQDVAKFAKQTGAPVYGHYTVTETAYEQGVPEDQLIAMDGGDVFQFDGYTVEAIHILHSGIGDIQQQPREISNLGKDLNRAIKNDLHPTNSPEHDAWEADPEKGYGSSARNIKEEGVYALLFTFGKNFTFIYYDSANANLTPEIEAAMAAIGGRTDLATLAYAGGPEEYVTTFDMPEIKLFNPRYFFPSHGYPSHIMDPSPLFQAIYDELSGTTPIHLMPKQALCFNVKTHKLISNGILKGSEINRNR